MKRTGELIYMRHVIFMIHNKLKISVKKCVGLLRQRSKRLLIEIMVCRYNLFAYFYTLQYKDSSELGSLSEKHEQEQIICICML